MRAGLSALTVTAVLMLSGCAAPPIATEVAQELQSEVQEIAVLTARGDTADAVAAAHALAARVRTAQADGKITSERAVTILLRVEQLIERLVRSGAAPAPVDEPRPVAGHALPVTPSAEPEPTGTEDPEPTEQADPPEALNVVEVPDAVGVEAPDALETPDAPGPAFTPDADSSGSDSSGSGSSAGDPGPAIPIPVIVEATDEDDDDDGGKGRGRGRSGGD